MITFDRQAGPLQNFKPVTYHGHRKKCIVFRPRATPGWGRGAPQNTPKFPPPPEKNFSREKKNFAPPPLPQKKNYIFYFLGVLRPQEHFLAEFFFSVKNSTSPPPPPPARPRPVLRTLTPILVQ